MWTKLRAILFSVLFVLSSAVWSQEAPSISPSSSQAIEQLQKAVKQLENLKAQLQNYKSTWETLNPALDNLLKIEMHGNESLTQLTDQLNNLGADSIQVSQLSTTLSKQFNVLSISCSTARIVNKIVIPVAVVSVGIAVLSIVTKGFTLF